VTYRACLISLEGQYNALIDAAEVEPDPPAAFASPYATPYAEAYATNRPAFRQGARAARSTTTVDGWSTKAGAPSKGRLVNHGHWAPPLSDGTAPPPPVDRDDVDPGDPLFTFPVLANWTFICTDGADFQQLMQQLDVGLLDTVRLPAPGAIGRKPAPPRTLPLPEVTPIGHVSLSHTNRAGEPDRVWYRGPLVPHPGGRQAPSHGVLPLLNSSDQARRIGPDGRENLSLAAAFEIGRLLALAEPSVVAAFLNWRKEGFENARRTALVSSDAQLGAENVRDLMSGFAARVASRILFELGDNDAIRFGDIRPPIDGGCPIEGLDNVDAVQLIATGFGLPVDVVRELIEPGAERPGSIDVPVEVGPSDLGGLAGRVDVEFNHLRNSAFDTVTTLVTDARAGAAAGGPPDALDQLLQGGGR
jgi:hypothetical protein